MKSVLRNSVKMMGLLVMMLITSQSFAQAQENSATAFYQAGMHQMQQGNLEAAAVAFEQASLLDPSYAMAYVQLGLLAARMGKKPEAVACINQAIHLRPDLAEHPLLRSKLEALNTNKPASQEMVPIQIQAEDEKRNAPPQLSTLARRDENRSSNVGGPGNKPAKPSKWHTVGRVFGAIADGAATQIINRPTYGGFGGGWGMGLPGGGILTQPIGGSFLLAPENKVASAAKTDSAEKTSETIKYSPSLSTAKPSQ